MKSTFVDCNSARGTFDAKQKIMTETNTKSASSMNRIQIDIQSIKMRNVLVGFI